MNGSFIRKLIGVAAIVGCIALIALIGSIVAFNHASESMAIQYPNGTVRIVTDSGPVLQAFGHVERYPKSFQFWYSARNDQGSAGDDSIVIRFNDGGHANISGSCRVIMPTDDAHLKAIFRNYVSKDRLAHELIATLMQNAVYFSGPLMSSKESAGTRRTELSTYIEDQAINGIYETVTKEVKQADPITGEMKTIQIVEIATDPKTGRPLRQKDSPLEKYGITLDSMAINGIKYDDTVEKQIQQQQALTMQIQTAVAQAKTAEQQALTAQKEGEANAAKAKWEQEVLKAKAVTAAEQERDVILINAARSYSNEVILASQRLRVAELDRQAAEQSKQQAILIGQGKATAAQLEIEANGGLYPKLDAWIKANQFYAEHLPANLVPAVQMGGNGTSGNGMDFISLLQAKLAKDLALDMNMAQHPATAPAATATH